jgi:glycine dehydrogenase
MEFVHRHIGPDEQETSKMLDIIGMQSIEELIANTVPSDIFRKDNMGIGEALTEQQFIQLLKQKADKNIVCTNFIGMGYYGTHTPGVIQRNIFENPGWYTQYTPYQAEISQGRLEALLNYQTMVSDLTALPIANASLLDEATAVAEAMHMTFEIRNKKSKQVSHNKIFLEKSVFPQTIDVVRGRAIPKGIEVVVGDLEDFDNSDNYFAVVVQYPTCEGQIIDFKDFFAAAKKSGIYIIMAADILALALLTPPGDLGADVAVGSTQRFGVPLGYGGPHAAYMACSEEFTRHIPGRIIGVSIDKMGNRALRMALQTREQHIKREKATSNICTAQALLAIMASMYAVYHGAKGIMAIAEDIHNKANVLASGLTQLGYKLKHNQFFDTLTLVVPDDRLSEIADRLQQNSVNIYAHEKCCFSISVDETTTLEDINLLIKIFNINDLNLNISIKNLNKNIPTALERRSTILSHPIFNTYHSETEMLRYIKRLEAKDLSLCNSMIPLGSCTMKLNATAEMQALSWNAFANMHPFAPADQAQGYLEIVKELEEALAAITAFDAVSLQPNSGAQGEYAGLMVIRAYHLDKGNPQRNVALIPQSAHGTNPASAAMADMEVVVVKCDDMGNIEVADLRTKAEQYSDRLSCLMLTYPSTHGVFEEGVGEMCNIIHAHGGKVYMDGANMNAQVGLTAPGIIGADVCHLNLHKTFAIPHGGGGPGMGPICVKADLAPYLPSHPLHSTGGNKAIYAVSATPYGSASILLISYGYIKMLGDAGLKRATAYAILNANYLKSVLEKYYPVLYTGKKGTVAHEFILDIRPYKKDAGIDAIDVAKRLMDYGFHAPTVAFPVPGTLMIEPTESESLYELDRFCDAMIAIRAEIQDVIDGNTSIEDNPLIHAPHTAQELTADEWTHSYARNTAAYPIPQVNLHKFWPSVARIDNTYGDRNLICTCPPIEAYMN